MKVTSPTWAKIKSTRAITTASPIGPVPIVTPQVLLTNVASGVAIGIGGTCTLFILGRRYGLLYIILNESIIRSADVYINGTYVGKSPLKHRAKPGRYEVVVKADGYIDYHEIVNVRKGEITKLIVKLKPLITCTIKSAELLSKVVHLGEKLGIRLVIRNECRHTTTLVLNSKLKSKEYEVELGLVRPEELSSTVYLEIPK